MLAGQLFCDFELANCAIDGSPGALVWNNGLERSASLLSTI